MYSKILGTLAPQPGLQGSLISDTHLQISISIFHYVELAHFWTWLLQTKQWIFYICCSENFFFVCFLCPTNGVTFIIGWNEAELAFEIWKPHKYIKRHISLICSGLFICSFYYFWASIFSTACRVLLSLPVFSLMQ